MKKFTLIELLVVVAIIGILMTILLPSLTRSRNEAKSVICLSNLRNLSFGNLQHAQDNNGAFAKTQHTSPGIFTGWDYKLKKYLGRDYIHKRETGKKPGGIAWCPAFDDLSFQYTKAGASKLQKPKHGNDSRGAASRNQKIYTSYAVNQFMSNMQMNNTGYPGNGVDGAGSWYNSGKTNVKIVDIDYPSETMLYVEAFDGMKLTKFADAYFNPNHYGRLPFAKTDGSSGVVHYNSVVNDGKNLNTGNFNGLEDWEIRFWGCYVSPKF
ncbi:MAG: prepilin-type N-terminal cleavage/methylation domain-containing protein [Lentisphaeraceae bacterium]|nr:prepilin-type N-terminal cleavage/methylation domain-containing protein [Lentisphaeraceae bacterium]